MATTTQSYTGDGVKGVAGQTQLTFDFPYIKQSDVKVSLNGVTLDTTKYTFPTATSIQFNAGTATSTQEASGAPKSGVDILFYRQTDVDSAKAIFATGSGIRAKDLNNNIDQALFALQEVQDIVRSEEIEDSAITSAKIKDDSIVNADVNSAAAIDGTKISPDFGSQVVQTTGNIVVGGTVDGRDIAGDGNKLDGIETAATADQTAAEIRTLVEAAIDSNVFTDADHTKLNDIEDNATADQTADEIRTLVEAASNSNVFTDADHSNLNDIEPLATADQTAAEIRTLVEAATDSNVFTDADHTKLNNLGSLNALSDVNTAGVADGKILKYQASSSSFIIADDGGGGGGGGSSTFTGLSDTPANYGSAANKTLKINSAGDAVEFVDVTTSFSGLTDTPSLSGQAGKTVKINSNEDGVIYETINTDLVVDTTPQLGGDLETNSQDIIFGDNDKAIFGSHGDLKIYHDATSGDNYIKDESDDVNVGEDRDLIIQANHDIRLKPANGENGINILKDSSVELYHNNSKKFETTGSGAQWTGTLTAGGNIYFNDNGSGAGAGRKLNFGNDTDLSLYSDGTDGIIRSISGGNIKVEFSDTGASFTLPKNDGSSGTFLKTNGSGSLTFGSTMYEYTSGSNTYGWAAGDIIFNGADITGNGTITGDEVLQWDRSALTLDMGKYGKYRAGSSQWYTKTDATGGDEISNNGTILSNTSAGGEVGIFGYGDISIGLSDDADTQLARFKMPGAGETPGTVELYYVNNPYFGNKTSIKRLETHSTGVTVTGTLSATNGFIGVDSTVADGCIYENNQTISNDFTTSTTKNSMSAGPITIASGKVLTVPDNSTYTIV